MTASVTFICTKPRSGVMRAGPPDNHSVTAIAAAGTRTTVPSISDRSRGDRVTTSREMTSKNRTARSPTWAARDPVIHSARPIANPPGSSHSRCRPRHVLATPAATGRSIAKYDPAALMSPTCTVHRRRSSTSTRPLGQSPEPINSLAAEVMVSSAAAVAPARVISTSRGTKTSLVRPIATTAMQRPSPSTRSTAVRTMPNPIIGASR